MPEWGHLPIPAKLLKQGVTDLLRISDARMSGTSYGAVVLHVAPESAVGGPARARARRRSDPSRRRRTRRLDLVVDEAELEARRARWEPPPRKDERGYRRLHVDHVLQAERGLRLRLPPRQDRGGRGRGDLPLSDAGPRHRRARQGRPRALPALQAAGYDVRATDLAHPDVGSRGARRAGGLLAGRSHGRRRRRTRSHGAATSSCTRLRSRSRSTTRRTSSSATTC